MFLVLALSLVVIASYPASSQVIITEFMADNAKGPGPELRDEDGSASDWIELSNVGPEPVDLSGWYLTDDPSFLPKWQFPPGSWPVGSVGVIFASGKNKIGQQYLHSNFELPDEDGYLALVRPNGVSIAQEFTGYPKQRRRASWGFPAGSRFSHPNYLSPTPGAPNTNLLRGIFVSEIMYAPAAAPEGSRFKTEDFQFIEVTAASGSTQTWNLEFSLSLTASSSPVISPEQPIAVIVANRDAYRSRYGSTRPIAGEFTNRLSVTSGSFTLRSGDDSVFVVYDNRWYLVTAGPGFSLVNADLSSAFAYTERGWRPSAAVGGSPGAPDPPPTAAPPPGVVVNEILAHSGSPYEDAIELFNAATNDIDISGWFLSDNFDLPKKFCIPDGTVIPAGGYIAFDEHSFNPEGVPENARFEFRSIGEDAYLFSADGSGDLTGYAHGFKFGAAPENVTVGRHTTSTGEEQFLPLDSMSFFAPNSNPRVGPIVISEVMYDPPDTYRQFDVENLFDEFVEIHNMTDEPIPLGGRSDGLGSRWRLRSGVDFAFPAGSELAPGGYAVVTSFDPKDPIALGTFRAAYRLAPEVPVFGPWTGKLSNHDDTLRLVYVNPAAGESWRDAEVEVDRLHYSEFLPWPRMAAGYGASLHRSPFHLAGDDPAHWRAMAPSPGRAPPTGPAPIGVTHSPNQSVAAGTQANLFVETEGREGMLFQWFFAPLSLTNVPPGANIALTPGNGRSLYQASDSSLALANVSWQHGGRYTCFIIGAGGATSVSMDVEVTHVSSPRPTPVVTILQPASTHIRTVESRISLSGVAAGAMGVAGVHLECITSDGPHDYLAHGTTNWAATIPLAAGTNQVRVMAFDSAGVTSAIQSLTVVSIVSAPVQMAIQGSGTVTGLTNGQSLIVGKVYRVVAKPAPGSVFVGWQTPDGVIVSASRQLSFEMVANLNLTATFVPNPFLALAGTYHGLFFQTPQPATSDAGAITFTLGKNGHYAGAIRTVQGRKSFTGQLPISLATTRHIIGPNGAILDVVMRFMPAVPTLGGAVYLDGWTNELIAVRRPLAPERPASGDFALEFTNAIAATALIDPAAPGRLQLNRAGRAVLRAPFLDELRIEQRLPVSADGWLPVFATKSRTASFAFGWLTIAQTNNPPVAGTLYFGVQGNPLQPIAVQGTAVE